MITNRDVRIQMSEKKGSVDYMKSIGSYKKFRLYEITDRDLKSGYGGYEKGDIIAFRPDDEDPAMLGYEEWCAGSLREMHEFIDSDEQREMVKAGKKSLKKSSQKNPIPNDELRINQGYVILQFHMYGENKEIVLAHSATAPDPYVSWLAQRDNMSGKWEYGNGHYSLSQDRAIVDFNLRSHMYDTKHLEGEILNISEALLRIEAEIFTSVDELYCDEAEDALQRNKLFKTREFCYPISDHYTLIKHELIEIMKDDDGNALDYGRYTQELFYIQNTNTHKRDKLFDVEVRSGMVLMCAHGGACKQVEQLTSASRSPKILNADELER